MRSSTPSFSWNLLGQLLPLTRCPNSRRRLTAQTKPVRIVFAAGGGSDFLPRVSGQRLSERFGQQFVIESRTGAGSNIAAEAVVNAPPGSRLAENTCRALQDFSQGGHLS